MLNSIPYALELNTSSPFLSGLAKIWLANHIKSMAELLHADMIQQLEVALLGSPVAQLIDLLATRADGINFTKTDDSFTLSIHCMTPDGTSSFNNPYCRYH